MITRIYSVQHKLLVSLFVSIQLLTRSMQRTIEQRIRNYFCRIHYWILQEFVILLCVSGEAYHGPSLPRLSATFASLFPHTISKPMMYWMI